MRNRSPDHTAALDRRLALLADELTGVRPARAPAPVEDDSPSGEPPWWDDHTRIAESRLPAPPAARPPIPEPVLLEPGRHAARRRGSPARDGVGSGLGWPAGGVGVAHLLVVAVVVTLGLGVTCWWLVRGDPRPADEVRAAPAAGLVTPAAVAAGPAAGPAAAPAASAAARADGGAQTAAAGPPGTVTVDVAGKVRHPGIAVLASGSRVVDALQAAGGARPGVSTTGLNLARVLTDGEQLLVGVPAPTGIAAAASSPAPTTPGGPSPGILVNLNSASSTELDELPEVGPVTATAILSWRDQHGGFTSVDELLEVDGIGEATLAKLAPYVTV